jgi:hypothetical protein
LVESQLEATAFILLNSDSSREPGRPKATRSGHKGHRCGVFLNDSSSIDHGLNACAVARDLSSRCCLGGRCVADDFVKNGVIVTASRPRREAVTSILRLPEIVPSPVEVSQAQNEFKGSAAP